MAVQNMYLTATAYGVGCYWGTGGVTFYPEAKAFFGLGENDKFLGFLFVGNVKEGFAPQGRRNPIEDKVSWVGQKLRILKFSFENWKLYSTLEL